MRASRWLGAAGLALHAAAAPAQPMPPTAAVPAPAASPAAPGPAAAQGQRVEVQARPETAAEQRRDALEMKTVIGRDELDRHGDFSVLDVLQRQAGVSVQDEQPRLRGLGGGHTQILLNGEPAPPGFSLDQLSPSDIERVEIVKGPTAEFGGSAGTINIVLRTPPRTRQLEARGGIGYRALHPVGWGATSWGDRLGDMGFQLPLTGYRWANAGDARNRRLWRTPEGVVIERESVGTDQWRGGGLNFGPRLDWKLGDRDTLQWHSFLQRQHHDNRSAYAVRALQGPAPEIVADTGASRGRVSMARTQLQWAHRNDGGLRLELKAGLQRHDARSMHRYVGERPGDLPLQRETSSEQHQTREWIGGRWRQPWADGHVLLAGLDHSVSGKKESRRVVEDGVEWSGPSYGRAFDVQERQTVLFAQDEWSVSELLALQLGVRLEGVATRADDGTSIPVEQQHTTASPIAQLRWALDAKSRDVLRASVARTHRLPDLAALMGRYTLNTSYERDTTNTPLAADSAGNPWLRPERALALELGWERQLPGGGVLSLGVFHRRIEDLIRRRIALETVEEATAPRWVSRPVNLGSARSSGVEFELKGRAADLLPARLSAWDGLGGLDLRAALNVYRSSVEQIDDPDARLEGQPPWTLTLGVDRNATLQAPGFGVSLTSTPAFTTRQTDLQRVWRERARRIDLYAMWRLAPELQLRLSVSQAAARPIHTLHAIEDLDGFVATNDHRREQRSAVYLNLKARF